MRFLIFLLLNVLLLRWWFFLLRLLLLCAQLLLLLLFHINCLLMEVILLFLIFLYLLRLLSLLRRNLLRRNLLWWLLRRLLNHVCHLVEVLLAFWDSEVRHCRSLLELWLYRHLLLRLLLLQLSWLPDILHVLLNILILCLLLLWLLQNLRLLLLWLSLEILHSHELLSVLELMRWLSLPLGLRKLLLLNLYCLKVVDLLGLVWLLLRYLLWSMHELVHTRILGCSNDIAILVKSLNLWNDGHFTILIKLSHLLLHVLLTWKLFKTRELLQSNLFKSWFCTS